MKITHTTPSHVKGEGIMRAYPDVSMAKVEGYMKIGHNPLHSFLIETHSWLKKISVLTCESTSLIIS